MSTTKSCRKTVTHWSCSRRIALHAWALRRILELLGLAWAKLGALFTVPRRSTSQEFRRTSASSQIPIASEPLEGPSSTGPSTPSLRPSVAPSPSKDLLGGQADQRREHESEDEHEHDAGYDQDAAGLSPSLFQHEHAHERLFNVAVFGQDAATGDVRDAPTAGPDRREVSGDPKGRAAK
eukprot:12533105-Alexandrium_andersonii.AAC.1